MTRARDLADLGSGITSGDLADDSVTTAKITDANVTQAKLAGEAVNESKLQVSNAPTNGYMLTAQSGNTGGLTWAESPSSSTTYGDVGTYALLYKVSTGITEGSTHAGSGLFPFGFAASPIVADDLNAVELTRGGTVVSGTWRAMGRVNWNSTSTNHYRATLYVRIS